MRQTFVAKNTDCAAKRKLAVCAIVVCALGVWPTCAQAQTPRPAAKAPVAQQTPAAGKAKPAPAPNPSTVVGPSIPNGAKPPVIADGKTNASEPNPPVARPAVREIKVLVAGGTEYRTVYSDWQARGSEIVAGASKHFEKQFGLRFKVVGFADWAYKKAPRNADEAFRSLHKVPVGAADLVVGFTLVSFAGPRGEVRGLTQYFSQYVVIPDNWGVPGATTRLVHEMSHVFGAFHVAEKGSVMLPGFEKTPRTFRFGRAAEAVIPLTRTVKLQEGVGSLPAETQQSLRALYRRYHHPSEGIDKDPVVTGYRYQSLRAELTGDAERSAKMKAEMQRVRGIPVDGALMQEEEPAPGKE